MNLHRTTGKADWERIAPAARTRVQVIAARTNGVVTPPNVITAIGLAIVVYGLMALLDGQFMLGLVLLVAGRLLDIADGMVAEATKTKSSVGEFADAAADKIGTLITIVVLFVAQVAPWWIITVLLIPQVVIPLTIFYKKKKGISVHPTRQGKLSMALTWVGIAGLLLAKAFDGPMLLSVAVWVIIGISTTLGLYALWQYATGRD